MWYGAGAAGPRIMRTRLGLAVVIAAIAAVLPVSAAPAGAGAAGPLAPSAGETAAPPVPAEVADKTFVFFGSGWGHGVGLSQWGAYGLAQDGSTHQEILTHFYSGTDVGPIAPADAPDTLRVGLTWDHPFLHVTAHGGAVPLQVGSPDATGTTVASVPKGMAWTIGASGGQFQILNAKGKPVGGQLWGSETENLYAVLGGPGRLQVREAGHSYDKGAIEFNLYSSCSGCAEELRAVALLDPRSYLYGLGEVPSDWPVEAMEAQADAARTYAFYVVDWRGQHRTDHGPCNCGLYDTTTDQVYAGWDKENQGAGWLQAVDATDGEVVTFQGKLILANYYSSSGGYTEDNENVWFDQPIPYLRAVCDPGDYTSSNPIRVWSDQDTAAAVGADLARYGYDVGVVTSFAKVKRSVSGRIIWVTVKGTGGADGTSVRVSGPVFSGALALRDDKVWINVDKNVQGPIRAEYDSLGCAPGLPTGPQQAVPGGLAQSFADGAIYRNDAANRTVWVREPLYDEYVAVQGPAGPLGLPRAEQVDIPAGPCAGGAVTCTRQGFDGGRIYFRDGVGAHEVHGAILTYFLGRGGAAGPLGFPTSDVGTGADGSTNATFEHATVTCDPTGSCTAS
jgi:SpoIID/LytB domain protein